MAPISGPESPAELSSDFLFRRKGKGIACGAAETQRDFPSAGRKSLFFSKSLRKKTFLLRRNL
jgi:hypothetical protein